MGQNKSVVNEQTVKLPDGRRLGYAEYGVPNGRPVLFFHGAPGSSCLHADMAKVAAQRGVRLIAVDRPGYGWSDTEPGRTLLSYVDDIAALTDRLKIDRFSIIGFSAGTPYPLACASRLPDRVGKVALVSALAPVHVPGVMEGMSLMVSGLYALAQANTDELRNTFAAVAPTASALLGVMSASAGDWDKKVLLDRAAAFELEYTQTLRCGTEGLASDFILNSGDWGFPIAEIKTETHLWLGTLDQNTPPAMTHYLASQLPNSRLHIQQGEGHFALYAHWDEILRCVV